MRSIIEALTYDLVDDICLAIQGGTIAPAQIPASSAQSLGPLLELSQVLGDAPDVQVSRGIYQALASEMGQRRARWFQAADNQGYATVSLLVQDPLAWNDFSIRASRAAQAAGFSKDDAWKLSAAIGEIYGNVIDHSERVDTGYVAYAANGNVFEFVVADAGIGVLASLRKNPAYSHIADSGTALEYALSEGVSRFEDPSHGFGFQPIFVGLANIATRLRFRSGDYCRELRRNADGTIPATTTQLARIDGLFCSVLCTAPDRPPL